MAKRIKKKSYENLSKVNIEKVIALLTLDISVQATESPTEKAITKKQACDILNIAYNTTRLSNIIEEYNEQKDIYQKDVSRLCGVVQRLTQRSLKRARASSREILSQISANVFFVPPGSYATFLKRLESPKDPAPKKKD